VTAINCNTEIGMSVVAEKKPRSTILITERRRDTIMAALFLWKRTAWVEALPEWAIACKEHDDDYALTKEDVDELIKELNAL